MMSILNVVLFVGALGALIYLLSKKFGSKKPKHVQVVDPQAQEAYIMNKKEDKEEKLTLEEKIELSWAFLVNIKNQVLERFSESDKKKVSQMGSKMLENGMHYEHNVDQEIAVKLIDSKTKFVDKNKDKDKSASRSR